MIVGINNFEKLLFLCCTTAKRTRVDRDSKKSEENPEKYKIVNLGETELF